MKTLPFVDLVIRDLEGTATRPVDADPPAIDVIFERDDGWHLAAPLHFECTAFESWPDRWVTYWLRGRTPEGRGWVSHPISRHRYLAGDCQIAAEEQIRNLIGRWGQQGAAGYRRALLLAGVIDELLGKNLLGTALDSSPEGCSYKAARRFVRETLNPNDDEVKP
jgi:hypothetical protein